MHPRATKLPAIYKSPSSWRILLNYYATDAPRDQLQPMHDYQEIIRTRWCSVSYLSYTAYTMKGWFYLKQRVPLIQCVLPLYDATNPQEGNIFTVAAGIIKSNSVFAEQVGQSLEGYTAYKHISPNLYLTIPFPSVFAYTAFKLDEFDPLEQHI